MLHYNNNNGDITWYYFFKPGYVFWWQDWDSLIFQVEIFKISLFLTQNIPVTPLPQKKKKTKNPKASFVVLLNFLFLTTSYRLNGSLQKV